MVTAGLTLNIIGTLLIAFFGVPQPSHQETVGLAISGPLADRAAERTRRRRARYERLSRLALACLVLGFALQLVAHVLGQ